MTRPPPSLDHIRSFEASARHLSFTRAAEELGFTQAAISAHVRALEAYVGRALFIRRARSLELTETGEAFLPTLRPALTQIDAATDAIVTGARDRSVVVACPMSLAENWLPGVLDAFLGAHPGIEVVVHGTIWDGQGDDQADLQIVVTREGEEPAAATRLWPETLSLVCAPRLAGAVGRTGLLGLRRIVVSGRQEYWPIFRRALGGPDAGAGPALRTNSSNVSLELAAAGLGVTVALTSLAETYVGRGLLAEPFATRPPSPWGYYLTRRGRPKGSAADRLAACLAAAAAARSM
ncbi:MAG: LysR substrate-binding domain-containing protein [Pseudomonadota bacterium]